MINYTKKIYNPQLFITKVNNKIISPRYTKVVNDFILSLDYLDTNTQAQEYVNKILRLLSKFIREDFSITDFIKYDYINLDPEIKKFLGGPGSLKRALDCNDLEKMISLISIRVTYLIDQLSQKLISASFVHHYKYSTYKQELRATFRNLILALYSKGLRNFSSMTLGRLDLSNQTFESCNFHGCSFYKSNLENSCFLKKCDLSHTSFEGANTLYMSISPDCSTELAGFISKLDLIKIDASINPNRIRFSKAVSPDELIHQELRFVSQLLKDITDRLEVAPGEILKDEKFNEIYANTIKTDVTDELEIASYQNREPLFIKKQCLILQDFVELSDVCGIRYGNNIQLYSIKALITRLRLDKKCPLNMSLIYVKKNLFNLIELWRILCQI
jgi:hypothetical protein